MARKSSKLNTALEIIEELNLSEQELLLEIVKRRMIEKRREEILKQAQAIEEKYREGKTIEGSAEDLIKYLDT